MLVQNLACASHRETFHQVPPGAVAVELVQLSDWQPVHCRLRIPEVYPDGRGGSVLAGADAGPKGKDWWLGETVPLWGKLSGNHTFDSRVQTIAIHHDWAPIDTEDPVAVMWLERKDLLDRFRLSPRERYRTWVVPEKADLPDNELAADQGPWTVKDWITVPCRGMRSGVLSVVPNIGQTFVVAIHQSFETYRDLFVAPLYGSRAPVVPLYVFCAPSPVDENEGTWRCNLPFSLDPSARQLIIRAWSYIANDSPTAPESYLSLSSVANVNADLMRVHGARWSTAVGQADVDAGPVCACVNPNQGGQQRAAAYTMNVLSCNPIDGRVVYLVNDGFGSGQDRYMWYYAASENDIDLVVNGVASNAPWECAVVHLYKAGPIPFVASASIKAHES